MRCPAKIIRDGNSGENICGFRNWIYCVYAWTQNSICSHTWRQIEFSVLIHNIYPKTQWNVNCHRNQYENIQEEVWKSWPQPALSFIRHCLDCFEHRVIISCITWWVGLWMKSKLWCRIVYFSCYDPWYVQTCRKGFMYVSAMSNQTQIISYYRIWK